MLSKRIETVLADQHLNVLTENISRSDQNAIFLRAFYPRWSRFEERYDLVGQEYKFVFFKRDIKDIPLLGMPPLQYELFKSETKALFWQARHQLPYNPLGQEMVVYDAADGQKFEEVYLDLLNPSHELTQLDQFLQGTANLDDRLEQTLRSYGKAIHDRRSAILMQALHSNEIIVQNSPPEAKSLTDLIKQSPGVALGSYAGFEAGAEMPLLLLATVPGGIILGGLSFAVTKALSKGLHQRIDKYFSEL